MINKLKELKKTNLVIREFQKDKSIPTFFKASEFGNGKCYLSGPLPVNYIKSSEVFFQSSENSTLQHPDNESLRNFQAQEKWMEKIMILYLSVKMTAFEISKASL